jgi:hypothetical protein
MIHQKEGGIQVFAGQAPSSPTAGSLLRTPLAGKAVQKNSAKCEFGKFASMKKYLLLLLIEHIWQNQKIE